MSLMKRIHLRWLIPRKIGRFGKDKAGARSFCFGIGYIYWDKKND